MEIKKIHVKASKEVLGLYVDTFNSEPWNETWTLETADMRINNYLQNPMAIGYEAQLNEITIGFLMGYLSLR